MYCYSLLCNVTKDVCNFRNFSSKENGSLLPCESVQLLFNPEIPKLLQKRNFLIEQESLSFWQADLPNPQMLLPESNRWICLWKQRINGELPATLIETLRATDKDCFPNIHTLLMIGCVLPTSSATAERSFSLLKRLKNTYVQPWAINACRDQH